MNAPAQTRVVPRPRLSDAPAELRKFMSPPDLAWPTLILFVLSSVGLICALFAAAAGALSYATAGMIVGVCHYWLFTVLHDASHRAISGKWDWLNGRIGDVAAFLMLPIVLTNANFRYMHIQHHRFANGGSDLDPDDWAGGGRAWTLPLRWLTIPYRYLYFYAKYFSDRPAKEKFHAILSSVLGLLLVSYLLVQGWAELLFWVYLIPIHLSFAFLALAFDYLPHHPHDVPENEDPYRATVIREKASWFLTPLLLSQNYHLLHHLYPRVPFYYYPKVWFGMREGLIKKGARVV